MGKKSIGIQIEEALWEELRVRSIREKFKIGELIEGWIRDYLKENPPKKRKALDL